MINFSTKSVLFHLMLAIAIIITMASTGRAQEDAGRFLVVKEWEATFTVDLEAAGEHPCPINSKWTLSRSAHVTARMRYGKVSETVQTWYAVTEDRAKINDFIREIDCSSPPDIRRERFDKSTDRPAHFIFTVDTQKRTYTLHGFAEVKISGTGYTEATYGPPLLEEPLEEILPAEGLSLSGDKLLPYGRWNFWEFGPHNFSPTPQVHFTWNLKPLLVEETEENGPDEPCKVAGSIISAETQSLGENVELAGTPYLLHYSSDRNPGYVGSSPALASYTQQMGGWTLNVNHFYDSPANVLYFGNGERKSGDAIDRVSRELNGNFTIGDGVNFLEYKFSYSGQHLKTVDLFTNTALYTFSYTSTGSLESISDRDGNQTTIERSDDGLPSAIIGPFGQRTDLTADSNGYLTSITNPAAETINLSSSTKGLLSSLTTPSGDKYHFTYNDKGRLIRDEDPAGGHKTLDRTDHATDSAVNVVTALNRKSTFETQHAAGTTKRVNTFPHGVQTQFTKAADGSETLRLPDGTMSIRSFTPDLHGRKKSSESYTQVLTMPGGLSQTIRKKDWTVTMPDPANPASRLSLAKSITINDEPYKSTFDLPPISWTPG